MPIKTTLKFAPLILCGLMLVPAARADSIHAVAAGAYWHHDSNWEFPQVVALFTRVGTPQDVAGSEDAVGHYEFNAKVGRITAAVDVYRAGSVTSQQAFDADRAALEKDLRGVPLVPQTTLLVSASAGLQARREVLGLVALYSVTTGDWHVRIRMAAPSIDDETLQSMDSFVLAQKWEKLAGL